MQEHRTAHEQEAYALGAEHARTAASWIGPMEHRSAREILSLIEAGDPRADEYLPRRPDLSGEFADDPTPLSIAREITGLDLIGDGTAVEEIDAICDAYEQGVSDTFEDACVTELRKWAE
jgi:hypothetical protein